MNFRKSIWIVLICYLVIVPVFAADSIPSALTEEQIKMYALVLADYTTQKPDYQDDFRSIKNQWISDLWGFENGAFYMESQNNVYVESNAFQVSDFILEIDNQLIHGTETSNRWELRFRVNSFGWYALVIESGGYVKFSNNKKELFHNDLSYKPGEINHIQISTQGSQFIIFINGQYSGYAVDPDYSDKMAKGKIAFKLLPSGDSPLKIQWSNLKIWDITNIKEYVNGGSSMEPTIKNGERMRITKYTADINPARGDIIAFNTKAYEKPLVKRIIGLPKEKVVIKKGFIYIINQTNPKGIKLDEPYLPQGTVTESYGEFQVPNGQYFVLGDNRGNSTDSRNSKVGCILREDVIGKVTKIYQL